MNSAHAKGLHEVVVRAKLQSTHAVGNGVSRGEKKDRCLSSACAQLFQDAPAVKNRQHHVQDDEVVVTLHREVEAILAIGGGIRDVAAFV